MRSLLALPVGHSFEWIISGSTIFLYSWCHSPVGRCLCLFHPFLSLDLVSSSYFFLSRRTSSTFDPMLLSHKHSPPFFTIKLKQTETQPQLFRHKNWTTSFESRRLQDAWKNWNRFMCFHSATTFISIWFHQCCGIQPNQAKEWEKKAKVGPNTAILSPSCCCCQF